MAVREAMVSPQVSLGLEGPLSWPQHEAWGRRGDPRAGRSLGCGHREGPGSDSASATLPGHRPAAGPSLPGCLRPAGSPGPAGSALPTGLGAHFREGAGAGAFFLILRNSLLAFSAIKLRRTSLGPAKYRRTPRPSL